MEGVHVTDDGMAGEERAPATFSLEVVTAALREVIAAIGKEPPAISADTRLDSLDLDSLDFAEFLVRLQEISGVFVDPASAEQFEVVGDLTRLRPLMD